MERRIELVTLNSHITCNICRGYFVDATTITKCLHIFCKSCLVKHLMGNNTCPTCNIVIHQTDPLNCIRLDRSMQELVYKLVPNLQRNEMQREREFYRLRGLPCPKDMNTSEVKEEKLYTESDNHHQDEYVKDPVGSISSNLNSLKLEY